MNSGVSRFQISKVHGGEQAERLQKDRALTPGAAFKNAIVSPVDPDRALDRHSPRRHIGARQQTQLFIAC